MPDGTPEIAIVGVVSKLLSDLVARNDQLPLAPTQVTPFHSSKPPSISVRSYLEDRCAAPHLPAPCRASSPHALDWQHPQVCRVLGRDIHPGADLHGPGRSVQPRICHLVAQRASAPDHGDHAREQGACRRQPRAPPPRLSRRALARPGGAVHEFSTFDAGAGFDAASTRDASKEATGREARMARSAVRPAR